MSAKAWQARKCPWWRAVGPVTVLSKDGTARVQIIVRGPHELVFDRRLRTALLRRDRRAVRRRASVSAGEEQTRD